MVYILLGTGFEEIEAVAPGDILRRARIPMQYVGVSGTVVAGAHGIGVAADILVEDVDPETIDMIVVPGGTDGVNSIGASEKAVSLLKYAYEHDKFVAAICAGPTLLARLGMLEGRNATCYPGCENRMGGAIVHGDMQAVRDGNIITGRAPGAAIDFGLMLSGLLPNEFGPEEIVKYMVYNG